MDFKKLKEKDNLFDLPAEEALERLGNLIDISMDLQRSDGIQHAMQQMDKLHRFQ
ncbi:hypothetical protein SAMN05518683_1402 [Salibacterium halotolerans]|uniref:Uncharacterized protein n=2 Tax=Salibacterium halotolerans TaxID=1884432 RepID=A0A1I5YC19_9BACI|nr:hypothetical protein SAMN05518683_1402 [Salibacterium halotolerans]